jgi:hypothetical protein
MQRQPLLKHTHIVKFGRILDMLYKPAEIAAEIGVNTDTIVRSYIPAGLPHTRDPKGRIWIHGPVFVAWARATIGKKKSQRAPLAEGLAWCLRCNQPVPLNNPKTKPINHYIELQQAKCPQCGTIVNRARACQISSPLGEVGRGL